ncbi:sodium:solute symporter family transporter [Compostibacter hankyongensis]|uniref:Na+:solute symporter n=1 Tax=Compostibacter hankyongensis TaxID=1007089 RepID=A0ABP8G2F3_9BACT
MNWNRPDIWIIAGYLVLMFGLSLWHRRFSSSNLENFFLGGRKIPGWLNGISYTAALVSPDAATGYGGLGIVTGAFISWWYLSRFGLALFIGGVLFGVFWRKLNLFTSLEFYGLRFPQRAASAMRIWIAVRTSLIAMPAWTGITLLAAYKILGPAFGLTKLETIYLIVPISFLFVFFSGYKGVVISNLIQMCIFFIGTIVLAVLTQMYFGGPAAMTAALQHAFGATHPEMLQMAPPATHDVFPFTAAVAWLFGQSIGYGGDAAPMGGAMEGQRILSTRTPSEALTMYVVTAVSMFVLLLLVTLPSISAALLWPELRAAGADRELVYGYLMKTMLPSWAMGLLVAAMMAATMSTVGDNLNFGSQVLVSDIYRRWFVRHASERHYMWMGKVAMALILSLAILVVFQVRIITNVAIVMLQLSCAELPANWAQWWWWRFNGPARIAASFGGAGIFCLVVLAPRLLGFMGFSSAAHFALPWWWQALLVMGLTTLLWVTVALLTPPDPEKLLRDFYARARPLGYWKPFRLGSKEGSQAGIVKPIFRGLLIAIIGFAAVCLLIQGLTAGWFGWYTSCISDLVLAVVLFIVFKRMSRSFLAYLESRTAQAANGNNPALPLFAGEEESVRS